MKQHQRQPFNVVVGFDFSDEAHLALDHAFALAGDSAPAFVHVLAVLDDGIGSRPDHEQAMQTHDRVAEVAETMRRSRELEEVSLLAHARIGSPAHSIVSLAQEVDADVVVVGTHGRTGVERLLLGSVAERVVRTAPCPVMVVRPKDHATRAVEAPRPEPPCAACVDIRRSSNGGRWWCDEHRDGQLEPHVYPATREPAMHSVRGVADVKTTAPFGLKPSALERAGRS